MKIIFSHGSRCVHVLGQEASQPIIFPDYTTSIEEEKEMLWEKAMRGYPLTEAEIAKL